MTSWLRFGTLLFAFCSCETMAKDIYVSTTGDDTNTGATDSSALKTLSAAAGAAGPGDIVRILPGTYYESIRPTRSGIPGKPITFRREGTGSVVLTHSHSGGLRAAVDIEGVSHIVIDGIDIDGLQAGPNAKVHMFVWIRDASNIVVRNCNFQYANAYYGFYVSGDSSYITLEDCVIDWNGIYNSGDAKDSDWGDLVMFRESVHHVLVQRNRLYHGPHNVIAILGEYSIIQDNIFDNDYTDVYGGTDLGGRVGAMVGANNVYQRNLFLNAGRSSDAPTNSFSKFEGRQNIARFNVFAYGNQEGVQSDAGSWSPIAYDNRIYNNTFYSIGAGAWRVAWYDTGEQIGNIKFLNNVVVDSRMSPAKGSMDNDITIAVKDFGAGDIAGNEVVSNMFSPADGAEPVVLVYGGPGNIDLETAERRYPDSFRDNVWKRAIFSSSAPRSLQDFELQPGSPGIDEGAFPTEAVDSGTSSRLKVGDSKFFIDGFGLVAGDVIRLEGSPTTAQVVGVDHSTNTLELSETVSFTAGQGVALLYHGVAPDIGARERGANGLTQSRPRPPSMSPLPVPR